MKRELQSDLEKQNKQLSILYDIALTVGKSLDLETILNDVLERIINFMGVDAGVIYVINYSTMEMVPVAFRNLSDKVVRDLCENKVKVGECMCGTIAQCDSEIIIYENASSDSRFTRESLKKEGMEFYAGLPLKAKGKLVGVICVITHQPYTVDPYLMDILRAATVPIGLAIENALLFETTRRDAENIREHVNFEGIITNNHAMKKILNLIRKITNMPSSILIYGESGTGKELIAKAIHYNSIRREKPFISINCAAIPEGLIESELFGYVKGSFTGASSDKRGLFEAANGGTIFLDEVEAMPKSLQSKLLRVLQDRTFFKIGGTTPITVDVRIIAACNERLEEAVKTRQFREDLYYRLNVIKIEIPPLRERPEDIPLLARYFLNKFSGKMGKKIKTISEEAMIAMMNYHWPGNVRELENAIERAIAVTETEEIRREDLPIEITMSERTENDITLETIKKRAEKEHIQRVLSLVGGNKAKAAKLLGIDTTTLWRKLNS